MFKRLLTVLVAWLLGWQDLKIVAAVLPIDLEKADGTWQAEILVQIDSTAEYSLIDRGLAKELGLYSSEQVVESLTTPDSTAEVIMVTFKIEGEVKRSRWLVINRPKEKFLVVLGRNDLGGFLIQV